MIDIADILEILKEANFDPENGKYKVLAELQKADKAFDKNKLYPYLGQLIQAQRRLKAIKADREEKRQAMQDTQQVVDIDWGKGVLHREELDERPFERHEADIDPDRPDLNDIEKVESIFWLVGFTIKNMRKLIDYGVEIGESVEADTEINAVGILPAYREEGYLFVPNTEMEELQIKRYKLSQLDNLDESKVALKTVHVKTVPTSPGLPSLSGLKTDLVNERPDLPNPATFYFETDSSVPFEETFLPVSKRMFAHSLKRAE